MDEWHFIDLPVRFPELIEKSNITFKDDDALGTLVRQLNFKILNIKFFPIETML